MGWFILGWLSASEVDETKKPEETKPTKATCGLPYCYEWDNMGKPNCNTCPFNKNKLNTSWRKVRE